MCADKIIAAAVGPPEIIVNKYYFLPMGELRIDEGVECGCEIGDLYYVPVFIISHALRVDDWVFALERKTPEFKRALEIPDPDNEWDCVAFRGTAHYFFKKITDCANLRGAFLHFALPCCALLRPGIIPDTGTHKFSLFQYTKARVKDELAKASAAGFEITPAFGLED
jgi:hypothetical protein